MKYLLLTNINNGKMKFIKYIPIGTISVILLIVWMQILTIPIQPGWDHYWTLIAFMASLGLYFVNTRWGLYATGVMLLLGVFNVISIFLGKYNISFFTGRSEAENYKSIKFDVRCMGLFLLYLLCAGKFLFYRRK